MLGKMEGKEEKKSMTSSKMDRLGKSTMVMNTLLEDITDQVRDRSSEMKLNYIVSYSQ